MNTPQKIPNKYWELFKIGSIKEIRILDISKLDSYK